MKIKLFFILCLFGAPNVSCSDNNENLIKLIAEKLNTTEVKAGDELIITGIGFSPVNTENIVKLNDLTIPVIAASVSELKLVIPKEATTGNLTVTVDEEMVDFGVLTVMQKTLFALKSDYGARKMSIVIIDPSTGDETEFLELPFPQEGSQYSDLCFLEKSNEFVILQKSEDDIEYHLNDLKVIRINADSKEFEESTLKIRDGVIDVNLISDGLSHVYLENFHNYDVAYKTTFYKLDLNTGSEEFVTEVNNDYVKKSKIMNENSLMILMEDRSVKDDSPHKIISVDLSNGTKKDIITGLTYVNGFSFGFNNNIFFATKNSYESESTLYDLDLTSGTKKVLVTMPKIYGWYAGAVYFEKSDELVYFLSAQDDTDDVTDYMYKIDVTDNSVNKINLKNAGNFLYQSEQVIFF